MKKAKLVLTTLAILTVIGGALAFKSSRVANTFYQFGNTVQNGPTGCLVPVNLRYVVDAGGNIIISYSSATKITANSAGCRATVAPNV